MTTIPKPADPTASFAATYDAWNRLVGITSGGTTAAGYEYDGAKRRIIKKSYTSGTLTETRHAYFTEPSKWQVMEERVDSSSNAERQFVWGLRYIDDLVLRDRDTDGNGTLDERLYSMQDANWNVTGLVSTSGTVQERYAYSAYGKPMFLDASFVPRSSSSFAWERLFAGYVWDADVEWYAVRHRVYVVGLGWVQRDPVGARNLYEYCASNPTLLLDPYGDIPNVAAGGLAGCFGGASISVIGGLLHGRGWTNQLCRFGIGCIAGAIFGAIAGAYPKLIRCMLSLGYGASSTLPGLLCDSLTGDCTRQDAYDRALCAFAKLMIFGVAGCLLKEISPGTPTEQIEKLWATLDLLIGGYAFAKYCGFQIGSILH